MRSGCGAFPAFDNCLNFSLENGENLAIFDQRDLPNFGIVSGEFEISFMSTFPPAPSRR